MRLRAIALVLFAVASTVPGVARAAIIENAPPIDVLFENQRAGGGAYIPLLQFRLLQSSGSATLTNVKVSIRATSTPQMNVAKLTNGEIWKLQLYRESGANLGFQPDSDTLLNTAANMVIDPATSTEQTITVDTGNGAVGSISTEFFVVALATSTAGLTNGHQFYATTSPNWITTSGGSIGTQFTGSRAILLEQTVPIKISEFRLGATGNAGDEFFELYNPSEFAFNLQGSGLVPHLYDADGIASSKTLTYYRTVIPKHGFFLIGSQTNYTSSGTALDAAYSTLSGNTLIANGALGIATSSATTTSIDRVAWGAQPAGNAEGTRLADLAVDNSYERKSTSTASAASMSQGGFESTRGNSGDTGDNSADFVLQTSAGVYPQNSMSPKEFSFGGGFLDIESPMVSASFPSDQNTNVPIDMQYIGFNFNKTIATGTIISATATTTVTLRNASSLTNPNLCGSVQYNPFPSAFEPSAKCILSANLAPSTIYAFIATSTIRDISGNPLDQNRFTAGSQPYSITFTTGGSTQTSTNLVPPQVLGASPFNSAQNVPTNLSVLSVEFSQANMNVSTLTNANITLVNDLGAAVVLSNFVMSTSTGKNLLTMMPASLGANRTYTLTVGVGVRNTNGVAAQTAYISKFTTSGSTDSSAPILQSVLPSASAPIAANMNDFLFVFDDTIDPTTATSGSVSMSIVGGANIPGTVYYNPVTQEGHFVPNNVLPSNSQLRLTLVGGAGGLKNTSGTPLAGTVTRDWTVEATNSDTQPPSILFANANDFSIAISFNEAVNSGDAKTLANYSVTAGSGITLSALAGHSVTYDSTTRTAQISGVKLPAGTSFTVTANNIKDMSGNAMTTEGTFTGTVAGFSSSGGGLLGPGTFSGSVFGEHKDFSASGIGFVPPVNIQTLSNFVSASTTYIFELPISRQIPANGTIVLTFPSAADFGICCAATSSARNPYLNEQNKDINGPGTGTVGIAAIARDAAAKTVTLTLNAATRSESGDAHDFLRFGVVDLKNPSIPKGFDSPGYSIDIKSRNASGVLLETFSANPIYINGRIGSSGATTTIRGRVSGNGANLQGVDINLFSPQIGQVIGTTDASGVYQFTDIPINTEFLSNNFGGGGEYMLSTNAIVSPTGTTTGFFGKPNPTPVLATSTSVITRDFALTATSSAVNIDIKMTAALNTFTATEQLDVFAGGPGEFVVRTITPGTAALSATKVTTMPLPQVNGFWGIGFGPAMPKGDTGFMSGPPSTTWSMPKPIEVEVKGCPTACIATVGGSRVTEYTFAISVADKTITGILKDGSGNTVSDAGVYAYSPSLGLGSHGQTAIDGTFSIRVVSGSYNVGAFAPGVGQSREVSVVIDSSGNAFIDGSTSASTGVSGANPFVLKMTKPGYTITGRVTDGTNAVGNAPVFAYRTDGPGHADSFTDSSAGTYTLYVDSGAWKVNVFIPGFGQMTEQTVTVAGANQENIDFAPASTLNFSILSGNIYEDSNSDAAFTAGEGIEGAIIRVSGSSGTNEAVSGSDGAYSVRVRSGSGYSIADIFKPGYGRIAALGNSGAAIGAIDLTASTTQNIRVAPRRTITINIKDSNGNLLEVPKAFIDLFDTSTQLGNHVEITSASSTSLQIANGASTTIRAFIQGVPSSNISVASDDGTNTLVLSGVLQVNGAETIKIVVNTASANLSVVSGTVYHTAATSGNELTDAWISFVNESNGVFAGTQATTSGAYRLSLVDGTYKVIVSKPGYIDTPTSITISGNTTRNFVLTSASRSISGTVTAGGSLSANAFVRAVRVGGGQAVTKTDTDGTYRLSVGEGTWRVFAAAEGYVEAAAAANPISIGANSASSITVALTTTASISSTLMTSNTFTDTSAGSISDTATKVKVDLDANTLGSAGSNSYLTVKETSNFPNTVSVNIVASKAKDINAYSGSSQVKNLQTGKKASIELTYTKAELALSDVDTSAEVDKLKVVSYSEDKKEWESLSTVLTYKDSSGNVITSPASNLSNVSTVAFTSIGSHFSLYALSSATNSDAPAAPANLTATAGNPGSNTITLSWNSSDDSTGYFIYRDTSDTGSFPLLNVPGNVTNYTDTAVTNGTTYYYKVSASKESGSVESAASSAVSAKVNVLGGGGGGGGGGSAPSYLGGSVSDHVLSKTPAISAPASASQGASVSAATLPNPPATPSITAISVSPVFTRVLKTGSRSDDVKRLQQILNSDPDTKISDTGPGSPDNETDFFGLLTKLALQKFQKKHGIISSGSEETTGFGVLGPKTRAKLQEVSSVGVSPAVPATPASVSAAFTRSLDIGTRGEDVKRLQQLLNNDPDTKIANTGPGSPGSETEFLGTLTQKAIGKFQEKYNLAKPSDPGYGFVGPMTRAKLGELGAPTASSVSTEAELEKQVKDLQKLIENLQKQVQVRLGQ
ncbi:MAG: hypothetical protein HYS59_01965 [Candidatus Vogelbacteria bacterium]|nr:hypothetical protein [Candidatus Vogelbacteria bacterium]